MFGERNMHTLIKMKFVFMIILGCTMGSLFDQPPCDEKQPVLRQTLLFDKKCLPQFEEQCKDICAKENLPLVRIDRIQSCGVTTPTCLCGGRVLCTENDFQEIKLVVGCTNKTRLPYWGSPYDSDCNRLSDAPPCQEAAAKWPMANRYSSRKSDLLMDSRLVPEHMTFWSGLSDGSGWCHNRDDWYVPEQEPSLRGQPQTPTPAFDMPIRQLWKPKGRFERHMKGSDVKVFVNSIYVVKEQLIPVLEELSKMT